MDIELLFPSQWRVDLLDFNILFQIINSQTVSDRCDGSVEFFQRLPETELLAMLWAADFDPASPSNVSAFASSLPPSEGKLVSTLLDEPQPPEAEIIASTCLQKLYRQSLEMRVTELSAQLGAPDLSFEQIEMLQKEKIDLRRQLNDIPRHFSV